MTNVTAIKLGYLRVFDVARSMMGRDEAWAFSVEYDGRSEWSLLMMDKPQEGQWRDVLALVRLSDGGAPVGLLAWRDPERGKLMGSLVSTVDRARNKAWATFFVGVLFAIPAMIPDPSNAIEVGIALFMFAACLLKALSVYRNGQLLALLNRKKVSPCS